MRSGLSRRTREPAPRPLCSAVACDGSTAPRPPDSTTLLRRQSIWPGRLDQHTQLVPWWNKKYVLLWRPSVCEIVRVAPQLKRHPLGGGIVTPRVLPAITSLNVATPLSRLVRADSLSRHVGSDVYLKLESELPTGSFKVRGAMHALTKRRAAQPIAEVVAASTGNHGAAVAYAARQLNIAATIFLPTGANPVKTARIESLGAKLVGVGGGLTFVINESMAPQLKRISLGSPDLSQMRFLLFVLAIVAPSTVSAQAAGIVLESSAGTRTVSITDLTSLPQDTVRARMHDGPERVFLGPRLSAVLAQIGVRLDSLRGTALAQYVLVEARDNYRVVFGIAELSSEFTPRRIILALTMDGQPLSQEEGPVRVVVEGELRPARWVRQVSAVRVRAVP